MNEKILTELFKLKLEITDKIIDRIPGSPGKQLKSLEKTILNSLNEATEEYCKGREVKRAEQNIKSVSIE